MIKERSLEAARDAGVRLLTACLWVSTLSLAIIGWLIGSGDVWLATGLTVLLNLVPTWCWVRGSHDASTRTSFGVASALHPAVYVFLFQGHPWQMDLHMYFFAALAALTVLYDRRPLLVAAGIIVFHHLALQSLAPSWAFAGRADTGRVLMHAGIVLLQTTALSVLTTRLARMIRAHEEASRHSEELANAAAASEERARIALAERDNEYRLLAEHSNDVIVRIGMDGRRTYVSPASKALLGYAPDEMLDRSPLDAIHADDRANVVGVFRSIVKGSENRTCTYREQHRDGHYVWIEAVYWLNRDSTGAPTEVIASVRDISRREAAEQAASATSTELRESHRFLSMAASIARVGYWRLNLITNHCFWSDEVCRIHGVELGYTPRLDSAVDAYHPDDRQMVSDIVARTVETGEDFEFTANLQLADGSTRRVVSYGQAMRGVDDAVIELFGVIQDISAQAAAQDAIRLSEEKYRLLADNATDLVFRTDENGIVVYASPSCAEVSTYTPEDLIGEFCGDFVHPEDGKAVHIAHMALITGAKSAVTVQYRLRCKTGGWRWLESHMRPWYVSGSKAGGVISAIRDIDTRKELEIELVSARAKAEGATHAKATFLANMSHEIRTPMNGVLGFTELLLSSDLGSEQRRHAELIADSGRSMMRLLNDILDVSKIESCAMQVATEPVDLRHIIRRCTDLMTPAAATKGVTLSAIVDADLPLRVVGDPLRLRQIVLNLVGNAVKFTEQGAIIVDAKADGATLKISVRDTGIGIPAERLSAIFDQFAQADDTTARIYGGTGLGLTISGELARLMGGSISVQSVVGEGTAFTVHLPLRVADVRAGLVDDPGVVTIAASRTRNPRVLIAEDHDINQELIVAMANRAGMEPVLACDGIQAVAMVQEAARSGRPFELVLMDMQMPEMDGLEATRQLRAAGHSPVSLPIVALTANAYADDIAACRAAGMQAHLTKPVRVRDLTDVLARFVAADTPVPTEAPKVSAKLLDRYCARKEDTRRRLDEIALLDAPDEECVKQAADLLHKLAGVAGMFGEAALGECAKRLEDDLLDCPHDQRAARVRAAASAFRQAA